MMDDSKPAVSDNSSQASQEQTSQQPKEPFRGFVLDGRPGPLNNFLNITQPSTLFVWSAIVIIIAMLSSVMSMKLQTSLDWGYALSQGMNATDGTFSLDVSGGVGEQKNFWAIYFFKILTYLFSIIGGLLPVWAIARLISDAVKSNGRLIAESIRSELNNE